MIQATGINSQAGQALIARDLVLQKLTRIIKAIVTSAGGIHLLTPDQQYAVRILQSRKRAWGREYDVLYSPITKMRERAQIEIHLDSDKGELLDFCHNKHGKGRLDCQACDFEYVDLNGFPMQESMAQVCPHCRAGILHVKTLGEWPKGTKVENGASEVKPDFYRHYLCDKCGWSSKASVK